MLRSRNLLGMVSLVLGLGGFGVEIGSLPNVAADARASRSLRVLVLQGTPYERGLTHGRALKDDIHRHVRLWEDDVVRRYGLTAKDFVRRFREATDFESAIRRWTPDLLDEIRGIADGSGLDFETAFVFQFMDEQWVQGPSLAREHCSCIGFAARGDDPTQVAQNMDVESFRDGFQVVLHIKYPESTRECFVLSGAGLIGLNGMNSRSVGVCVNTLPLEGCRDGLPVNCVIRGVLQRGTLDEASDFLRRIKHASGQNYLLGGVDRIDELECSANKVVRYESRRRDAVWHTNHPLINDDLSARFRALDEVARADRLANSRERFRCLQDRLDREVIGPRIDLIKSTLSSKDSKEHPVCVSLGAGEHPNKLGFFSFACTIMELSDRPRLHVAPGPPDSTPFGVLEFVKGPEPR